jgi:LmbE family N-acetylglucosaminyl deacetylase
MRRKPAPSGSAPSWWRVKPLPEPRAVAFALLVLAAPALAAQGAPLGPPTNGGMARFDLLLQQLAEPRRLLVIAAHPDDEDTGLLTLAVRGYGADAAYLALSRGEGGQNLIGTELGVALGLVRTQELLAARGIDGARQFFTRAYDFGYTRDLVETEGRWLPDSVLKDVVRVFRRFRPHVVMSVFSGTGRDGHGQHQMAGVMALRAFDASGDSSAFRDLAAEESLAPWTPLKRYTSRWFRPEGATVSLPGARLDPRVGRTIHQIAMESRSQHRSQDFGVLQRLGPSDVRLALEQSRVEASPDGGLFDGVPAHPSWLTAFADSVRKAVGPATLGHAVPALAGALTRVRGEGGGEGALSEALAIAAGVLLDARAERALLVAGESVSVELEAYAAADTPVRWTRGTITPSVGGWTDPAAVAPPSPAIAPGAVVTARAVLRVPHGAEPTRPYFTARPLAGGMYDWTGVPPAVRGLPDGPPVLTARFTMEIGGVAVTLEREVTFRERDQAVGEVRHPLRVVAPVEVSLDPDTVVWSLRDTLPLALTVTLRHNAADTTRGEVRIAIDGWPAPPPVPFALTRRAETASLTVHVPRPASAPAGDVSAQAAAVTSRGTYAEGATPIVYPHIRPTVWMRRAETRIRVADVQRPTVGPIGYVRGASDRVPEALRRAGLPVELLDANALARGDLDRYAVIVIGSRAYETDTALASHTGRLLEWVRRGGHLVVQYQQYEFVRGGYAPYPLTIGQPHDRITDETSPVTVLRATHPAFRVPNAIGAADWDGWPQERGLYFAGTWDAAYEPLLEMRDPGRPPVRGGLLVARHGEGTYVYTGLSFFRALPAGVPGAFRLFFNLLELGRGNR